MIKKITERYAGLFILAALLFSPPIVSIFNSTEFLFGMPILYLYLFFVWALIIALNAFLSKRLLAERKLAAEREQISETNA